MAKNKVEIDVKVDDKGSTKKVGLGAKKAGEGLDNASKSSDKYSKKQKGVAQAGMNSTKAFSKMTDGSNGLVAAYASLAAQLFAISAAFQFLKQAGQLKSLREGQQAYASSTGIAMKSLTNDIIAATEAQITFTEASQAAAIGVASGLNPEQLTLLGKAAKDASLILGRDVTDSFNRLVKGVTKAEPELLDELGIILRLDTATENYGRTIGKTKDELTAFERSQAVANDVLTQSEDKYGRILEITGASVNKFAQLGKAFDDIVNNIKDLAVKVGTPLANVLIDSPKMALGAVALLFKPVITSILPGLGNVVESSKRVAEASKTSFAAATAEVQKYQKALNAKKPIDASGARAGVAGLLAGQKGAKRSILEQAKAGKQLNNRQIKQLEEQIKKKKILRGKELRDFKIHLEKMKAANTAANKRMEAEFALSQQKNKMSLKRLEATAKGVFASIASAGAVAARTISRAFSALGWIALIATLGMTAYEFFKTKDATEDTKDEFDLLGNKLKEVNEELKHFNEIQNILNEDGTATISTLANIGNAFSNISTGMFSSAAKMYQKLKDEQLATVASIGTGGQATFESTGDATDLLDQMAIGSASRKGIGQQLQSTESGKEFLIAIQREAASIAESTDEKIRGSAAGQRYVASVKAIVDGTAENTKELIASREGYKNLALEVGGLTRVQIENAKVGKDLRAAFLPETKYEKYINGLKQEIALQRKLADDTATYKPVADAEIARLTTEISLMERLNEQMRIQAREKAVLNHDRQAELANNPFRLFDKGTNRKFNLRDAELTEEHLQEQLRTTKEIALEKDGISAAEREQIKNIERQISLNQIKLGQAREEMGEMYDIEQSFTTSLESGMTKAFTDIIQGTKSVKDAFKDMAMSILQAMSKVVAEMIAVYLLKQLISGFTSPAGFSPGDVGSGMSYNSFDNFARYGGVFSKGKEMGAYATGGVASGPQAGYPAMLHGTEAVVPLPNGKSIPVDMKGAGQVNNVTVNVHVDKDGNATEEGADASDMESAGMGRAIAKAVQKELQNQKRSGGILSPYGAA